MSECCAMTMWPELLGVVAMCEMCRMLRRNWYGWRWRWVGNHEGGGCVVGLAVPRGRLTVRGKGGGSKGDCGDGFGDGVVWVKMWGWLSRGAWTRLCCRIWGGLGWMRRRE